MRIKLVGSQMIPSYHTHPERPGAPRQLVKSNPSGCPACCYPDMPGNCLTWETQNRSSTHEEDPPRSEHDPLGVGNRAVAAPAMQCLLIGIVPVDHSLLQSRGGLINAMFTVMAVVFWK
jgi:hypothetical protein